jgi:predicted enzyme related to lactoylglutathione lyase
MTTYTKHQHGTFSWMELATTNADAAKKFYGGLFGWAFDDMPAGPGMIYSMAKLGDKFVGALYKMGTEMAGTPPHWAAYVSVDNVDDTAKKVVANGGSLVKEPFDVMDVGRMAVIKDPTGAHLCLWTAKKHIGADVKQEDGALCWNELYTSNPDAAGKFYMSTFGWKAEGVDMGPMGTYTLFKLPGETNSVGGMMATPSSMKGAPSHWVTYIQAADVDASAKKVNDLGGKIMVPPTDIPNIGRFSIVQDPAGATFALYKNAH